jgi:nitrate reductase NapE component
LKRVIALCLYLILAVVILSEARTVWVALTVRTRFEAVFPGAIGVMFYVAVITSVCAGANVVAVWLRQKWAVWANVVIGLWSIVLVALLGGPRSSQIIIACATLGVLIFSLLLPERFQRTE